MPTGVLNDEEQENISILLVKDVEETEKYGNILLKTKTLCDVTNMFERIASYI